MHGALGIWNPSNRYFNIIATLLQGCDKYAMELDILIDKILRGTYIQLNLGRQQISASFSKHLWTRVPIIYPSFLTEGDLGRCPLGVRSFNIQEK